MLVATASASLVSFDRDFLCAPEASTVWLRVRRLCVERFSSSSESGSEQEFYLSLDGFEELVCLSHNVPMLLSGYGNVWTSDFTTSWRAICQCWSLSGEVVSHQRPFSSLQYPSDPPP